MRCPPKMLRVVGCESNRNGGCVLSLWDSCGEASGKKFLGLQMMMMTMISIINGSCIRVKCNSW